MLMDVLADLDHDQVYNYVFYLQWSHIVFPCNYVENAWLWFYLDISFP